MSETVVSHLKPLKETNLVQLKLEAPKGTNYHKKPFHVLQNF